ncbi:MAG: universal stress protein, partial [Acidimicrobiales bacterium]|nr:universal stress protein [Acidimicrobiales bacterium]
MYRTIVVGAHKSDSARAAVDQATELARTTGAALHLVTSISKDAGPESAERKDAERSLEAMLVSLGTVPCSTHVIPGDVAKGIVSV